MKESIENQAELAAKWAEHEAICDELQKDTDINIRELIYGLVEAGVTEDDLMLAAMRFLKQA